MNRLLPTGLLCLGFVLGEQHPMRAQATVTNATFHKLSDQQPQLPTGGGNKALAAALVRSFRYPAHVLPAQVNGILHLDVDVTQTGKVSRLSFERFSLSRNIPASIDKAIRAAFRHLPPLKPGKAAGRPIATKLHISWSFNREIHTSKTTISVDIEEPVSTWPDLSDLSGEGIRPASAIDPADNRAYTYVEQMPRLPGNEGGGMAGINAAVQRALVVPADALEGRVFVSLIVEKQGQVSTPTIVKGLNPSADAAVLSAIGRLPTLLPGRQNGQPVRVRITLPVSIIRPAKHPATRPQPKH